jgi:hypothetical protein
MSTDESPTLESLIPIIFLSVFAKAGPKGKKRVIRSNPIQSVFPHEIKHALFGKSEYRNTLERSVVLPIMERIEKELNAGLSAEEAERAFPRAGQHNREIHSVHLTRENGGIIF